MRKRKICVVVTARPSYSRIRTALKAIAAHPDLELQLVVGASARPTIIAPRELPVGAITALIGAPLFIYLLKRG